MVGPFESLDDLSDLDGISSSRLASLGRYVVVR
jgi:DNA uptake protein ComE-like DNA-binding protein